MGDNSRQYTLSLTSPPTYSAENFVLSASNRNANHWVLAWPEWNAHALIVTGPASSGKTHLAHMWQEKAAATWLDAETLGESEIPAVLADARAAVLEHAHRVASPTTLLHLLNYTQENRISLLLTAPEPPRAWPYALPDLTSRLAALPHAPLHAPDDELLTALITKLFADKQLSVDPAVIHFLTQRIERSFAAARDAVETLDRASLEQGRAISLPMARQLLFAA